jgi:hypothetical protein
MNEKTINFRVSQNEFDALETYARRHGRTKTEIVREFLRSLERKNQQDVSQPVPAGGSAGVRVSARRRPQTPPTTTTRGGSKS